MLGAQSMKILCIDWILYSVGLGSIYFFILSYCPEISMGYTVYNGIYVTKKDLVHISHHAL